MLRYIGVAALAGGYALYLHLTRPRSPQLEAFDDMVEGGETEVGMVTRLAFEAAMAFKERHGECRYNNANRLVCGDFVRTYLREKYPDLRVVDRVKHATYAVELALTPTTFAVASARYARETLVSKRRGVPAPK
jgi:hypothetical protein